MRWGLLTLVLMALPSVAGSVADEADAAFALGNTAYAEGNYQQALSHYFLSVRLAPNRNVLFNIARCYEALQRPEEAYRYWDTLGADAEVQGDDREQVKAALIRLKPQLALVRVESAPSGASVYVDREDLGVVGKTPLVLPLAPGAHTLLVRLDGHYGKRIKVSVERGEEAVRVTNLRPMVGTVAFTGTPAGAAIRLAASPAPLGQLPADVELPPGAHLLLVEADGFLPSQHLVEVRAEERVSVEVMLTRRPATLGRLLVTSSQDGAQVRIDGLDRGSTPAAVDLAPGAHRLEVTKDDYESFLRTVEVGQTEVRVHANLVLTQPVVSAASKSTSSLDDAPASVTVIARDELEGFGYQTLAEALRAVRGLFFNDDRTYTYGGFRGFAPPGDLNSRVLVLYDGHPFNDVWAGQAYLGQDFDVDLADVERLEVVRGPSSVVFGTGALFGVINVVPRRRVPGRWVEAVAGGGGRSAGKARATGHLSNEAARLQVSVAGTLAAGAVSTDYGAGGVVQGLDDERALGANLSAEWNGLTLTAKWNQRRKQVPETGVPGTWYLDARGFAELAFKRQLGPFSVVARAAYDGSRNRFSTVVPGEDGYTETGGADRGAVELRAASQLTSTNVLTAALEGQAQFVALAGDDTSRLHDRALFSAAVYDDWKVTPWLSVHAGVRIDKYSDVPDWAPSLRAAVSARPYEGGLSKLFFGRSFRAPNVYELVFHDASSARIAPAVLHPEYLTTVELEHTHTISQRARLTASVFLNVMEQQITLQAEREAVPRCTLGDTPAQCEFMGNAEQAVANVGAELVASWRPARWSLLEAQYTFVSFLGPRGSATSLHPPHVVSLRGLVPLVGPALRVSAQLVFQAAKRRGDGSYVGEAGFANLGLSGQVAWVRYFAGLKNLFDAQPLVPNSGGRAAFIPEYGRSFWVEVGASL